MPAPFLYAGTVVEILAAIRRRQAEDLGAVAKATHCQWLATRWFIAAGAAIAVTAVSGAGVFFTPLFLVLRAIVFGGAIACLFTGFSWHKERRRLLNGLADVARLTLVQRFLTTLTFAIADDAICRVEVSFASFVEHGRLDAVEHPHAAKFLRTYTDPWLALRCPLADGALLHLTSVRHARHEEVRRREGLNAWVSYRCYAARTYETVSLTLETPPPLTPQFSARLETLPPAINNLTVKETVSEPSFVRVVGHTATCVRAGVSRMRQNDPHEPTAIAPQSSVWTVLDADPEERIADRDLLTADTLLQLLHHLTPSLLNWSSRRETSG